MTIEVDGVEYLTPDEFARRTGDGVTAQHVYDWVRSGRLSQARGEVYRLGRRLYVRLGATTRAERDTRAIGRPRGT